MQDLTRYAPIRVYLTGLWRVIFGLLLSVMAGAVLYVETSGESGARRAPGDMPSWWLFLVGLVLAVVALAFLAGGVGRIVSGLCGDCYYRAGAEGISIRLPNQGWFGRFKLVEHSYRWEEIEQLISFTRYFNIFPVARELHIRLYGGTEVIIERFYFVASIKRIHSELLEIRALAGK
jgi:hypothetical protein